MTARDNITRARARTPGVGVVIPLHGGARSNPRPDTARDNRWITRCTKGGSRLKRAWKSGRRHLKSLPSSRTGENPPYGMIGGIEETSASCEARYAPRSYPTVLCRNAFPRRPHRYGFIVSRHPYPIGYLANAEQALDGFNFGRLHNAAGGVRFAGCCCTGEGGHGVAIAGLADRVPGRRGDGLGGVGRAG